MTDQGPTAVIGVLMEYGLPPELALKIVYQYGAMLHPLTTAYRAAWEPQYYSKLFFTKYVTQDKHYVTACECRTPYTCRNRSMPCECGECPAYRMCGRVIRADGTQEMLAKNVGHLTNSMWCCGWLDRLVKSPSRRWFEERICGRTELWMTHLANVQERLKEHASPSRRYLYVYCSHDLNSRYFDNDTLAIYVRGLLSEKERKEYDRRLADTDLAEDRKELIRILFAH